jgi:DNA polymerase III alpha subunit
VEDASKRISKKTNRPWLLFTLSTKEARYELTLFSEQYERYGSDVTEGSLLLIEGLVRKTENGYSLNVQRVHDFRKAFPTLIQQLHWLVYPNEAVTDFFKCLRRFIEQREGSMRLKVSFALNDDYALEGELPYGARTTLTLEDIAALRAHSAFAGLEVTPVEMTPFPQKRFDRAY